MAAFSLTHLIAATGSRPLISLSITTIVICLQFRAIPRLYVYIETFLSRLYLCQDISISRYFSRRRKRYIESDPLPYFEKNNNILYAVFILDNFSRASKRR